MQKSFFSLLFLCLIVLSSIGQKPSKFERRALKKAKKALANQQVREAIALLENIKVKTYSKESLETLVTASLTYKDVLKASQYADQLGKENTLRTQAVGKKEQFETLLVQYIKLGAMSLSDKGKALKDEMSQIDTVNYRVYAFESDLCWSLESPEICDESTKLALQKTGWTNESKGRFLWQTGMKNKQLGRLPEAHYFFSNAAELTESSKYEIHWAYVASALKKYKTAIQVYEHILTKNPMNDKAWLGYAQNLLNIQDTTRAVQAFDSAYAMNQGCITCLQTLGQIYTEREDYTKAVTYYKTLLDKTERFPYSYYLLAKAKYMNKDYEGASSLFAKLWKMNYGNPEAAFMWIVAERKAKRSTVLENLRSIRKVLPNDTKLLLLESRSLVDREMQIEAIDLLTKFYKEVKQDALVRAEVYNLLLKTDSEKAEKFRNKSLGKIGQRMKEEID